MKELRTFLPNSVQSSAKEEAARLKASGESWRTNSEAQGFMAAHEPKDASGLVAETPNNGPEGISAVVAQQSPSAHLGEAGLLLSEGGALSKILSGEGVNGESAVLKEDTDAICADTDKCGLLVDATLTRMDSILRAAVTEAEGQVMAQARDLCGQTTSKTLLSAALAKGLATTFAGIGSVHPAAGIISGIIGGKVSTRLGGWAAAEVVDLQSSVDDLFAGIVETFSEVRLDLMEEVASGRAPVEKWAQELSALVEDPNLYGATTQGLVMAFLAAGANSDNSREYGGVPNGAYHFRAATSIRGGEFDLDVIAPPRGIPPEQLVGLKEIPGLLTTQGWQLVFRDTVHFEVRPGGTVHLAECPPDMLPTMLRIVETVRIVETDANEGPSMRAPESVAPREEGWKQKKIETWAGNAWAKFVGKNGAKTLSELGAEVLGA